MRPSPRVRTLRPAIPALARAAGIAFTLAAAAAGLSAQAAPRIALRFAAVVDGTGQATADAVVVVQADTIVSVGSGAAAIPAGAWVVDLRPYTAIPGLIDVHTHMTYWRDKEKNPRGPNPASPDSVVMQAADNARRTLEVGVTTVRDLNASNGTDLALRDAIAQGRIVGPRMFVSGRGLSKRRGDTTRVDLDAAIRARVAQGVDWIKMFGSTGSFQNVTGDQTFSDDEMRDAVRIAHAYGKPVAIHTYGAAGARAAVAAGPESIEHPVGVDDATFAEWARRGIFYVPTIDHNRFYAENAPFFGYTDREVMQLDSFRALNLETARRAHRAGVRMAMGSDAVYWMFGENTRELGWLVQAGLTPAEALGAATVNGAALLGMSDKLGRVAPGYYADIVAVEGDPLRDIGVVIRGVRWVMKAGRVVVDRRGY
jgi:imidazolonepropionase-like amidohydrolase